MKDFEMGDCPVSANLRLPFIGTSANGRHCTVSCDQVVTALISDGFTVLGRGPKSLIYQRVSGRSGRIRTSGPCLPKTVLYQAELHSVRAGLYSAKAPAIQPKRGFADFRAAAVNAPVRCRSR